MKKVKDKTKLEDLAKVVIDKRLARIEKMIKWIILDRLISQGEIRLESNDPKKIKGEISAEVENLRKLQSDISNILRVSGLKF